MKKILLTVGALLFSAAVSQAQNLVTGEKAPELKVGQWLTQGQPQSGRPTLVEFFFSRSEPSGKRLPVLDGFARDYKGRLNVVVISREPADRVAEALDGKGYGFSVALDDDSKTFTAYGVQFVPFCVLSDVRGRVLWFGNSSKFGDAEMKKALDWK